MKKIVALMISVLLVLSSFAALADTNNIVTDTTVTVGNLENGDSVKFVKIIEWIDGEGWDYTQAFKTAAAGNPSAEPAVPAIAYPEKKVITGYLPDNATSANEFVQGEISAANAAILAQIASRMSPADTKEASNNEAKLALGDNPSEDQKLGFVGLYCALVTPATANWLYNPIFVAADFSQESTSPNSQNALTTLSYSDEALAKKEEITLTKEVDGTADTKYDVNVGDVIGFTITSKVPAFSGAYTDPVYEINDTWEEGLAAPTDLVVKIGGAEMQKDTDYTYTLDATNRTFKVAVKESRLNAIATNPGTAQEIVITYNSAIASLDADNVTVTEKKNEATVKFSNNPGDSSKYSLMEDKTRNYTFSLDANLFGKTGESYVTDELIKVGYNEKGEMLTEKKYYHSGDIETQLSPLQGAEFTLYEEDGKTVYNHSNKGGFDGTTITSDANGRLNITGLDAGTYWLQETKAPTGFIKDPTKYKIEISATYKEIVGGTYTNTDNILVKYDAYKVLESYEVKVTDGDNQIRTSSYTIQNNESTENKHDVYVTKAEWEAKTGTQLKDFAGDTATPIKNVKGTELPSTGGMGTTILYIAGSIMVLAAVIFLVTKRRMNANND